MWSWGCPTYAQKQAKNDFFVFLGHFWATSLPFASINPTNPRTNPWNFHEKILRIGGAAKWVFFKSAVLNFWTIIRPWILCKYVLVCRTPHVPCYSTYVQGVPHHYWHPWFSNPPTALCTEEEQKFNGYVYGYVKILEEDSTRLVAALSLLSLMSSQLCSQTKIIIFKFWRAKLFSVILKLIFWKSSIF